MPDTTAPAADLRYIPDFQDLFAAGNQLRTRRFSGGQRLKLNLVAFGTMLLGGVGSGVGGTVVHYFLPAIPSWAAIGALFLLVALFFAKVLVPWMQRHSAELIRSARPPGEMHFTSSAEGLRWQDADIDFFLRWSGVERLFCTASSIAFMSGAIALVVPLVAFPDPAAQRQFLQAALEAIPADAARISRSDQSVQQLLART